MMYRRLRRLSTFGGSERNRRPIHDTISPLGSCDNGVMQDVGQKPKRAASRTQVQTHFSDLQGRYLHDKETQLPIPMDRFLMHHTGE